MATRPDAGRRFEEIVKNEGMLYRIYRHDYIVTAARGYPTSHPVCIRGRNSDD